MKRISVDIGGTFTDCFFSWDDQYIEAKALTTHNLALGFNEALDLACKRAELRPGHRPDGGRLGALRDRAGHQRAHRAQGPEGGRHRHPRFRGHHPLSRGRGYGEGLDSSMQQNLPAASAPSRSSPEA